MVCIIIDYVIASTLLQRLYAPLYSGWDRKTSASGEMMNGEGIVTIDVIFSPPGRIFPPANIILEHIFAIFISNP